MPLSGQDTLPFNELVDSTPNVAPGVYHQGKATWANCGDENAGGRLTPPLCLTIPMKCYMASVGFDGDPLAPQEKQRHP
jgi:hypothetical protein